ncbi:MAG: hypothetical protein IKA36_03235 [Clostridia bacterium]|nr:hypothetical protein [Clostridia bacterium]
MDNRILSNPLISGGSLLKAAKLASKININGDKIHFIIGGDIQNPYPQLKQNLIKELATIEAGNGVSRLLIGFADIANKEGHFIGYMIEVDVDIKAFTTTFIDTSTARLKSFLNRGKQNKEIILPMIRDVFSKYRIAAQFPLLLPKNMQPFKDCWLYAISFVASCLNNKELLNPSRLLKKIISFRNHLYKIAILRIAIEK